MLGRSVTMGRTSDLIVAIPGLQRDLLESQRFEDITRVAADRAVPSLAQRLPGRILVPVRRGIHWVMIHIVR